MRKNSIHFHNKIQFKPRRKVGLFSKPQKIHFLTGIRKSQEEAQNCCFQSEISLFTEKLLLHHTLKWGQGDRKEKSLLERRLDHSQSLSYALSSRLLPSGHKLRKWLARHARCPHMSSPSSKLSWLKKSQLTRVAELSDGQQYHARPVKLSSFKRESSTHRFHILLRTQCDGIHAGMEISYV